MNDNLNRYAANPDVPQFVVWGESVPPPENPVDFSGYSRRFGARRWPTPRPTPEACMPSAVVAGWEPRSWAWTSFPVMASSRAPVPCC